MHPGTFRGDVEWYVQKAVASGGPVLELGAGSGRVTLPIAQKGISITGLEFNDSMLARLRERAGTLGDAGGRVTAVKGDMRAFALNEQFALVVIPFRAFLHNLTRDDQLSTLRCAHAHLRLGGELALNVFHPSLEFMSANAGAHAGSWRWRETRKMRGGFVVYSNATRYDTVRQRLESMIRTEEFDIGGSLLRVHMTHLELAYLYPADIKSLLQEAGFDLVRLSGNFSGRPFERDEDELIVEARKR